MSDLPSAEIFASMNTRRAPAWKPCVENPRSISATVELSSVYAHLSLRMIPTIPWIFAFGLSELGREIGTVKV